MIELTAAEAAELCCALTYWRDTIHQSAPNANVITDLLSRIGPNGVNLLPQEPTQCVLTIDAENHV